MFEIIKTRLKKMEGRNKKFEEIADEWIEYKKDMIKESTYCEYLSIIENNLKPKFKGKNIMKIKDVNGFVQELNEKFRAKTVRGIICVFKAIIKYYEEEYNCAVNLKKIKLPKVCRPKVEIFTKREKAKLEQYCINENSIKTVGIMIALNTGMRIGEICSLQWKDIDLMNKRIFVTKTVERIHNSKSKESKVIISSPKTETSNRVIPMSTKLYEVLKPLKKNYRDDYYVLSGTDKVLEPRAYQNTFSRILKQNNMKHRKFHCLRHTFSTNCIEVGMDPKSLSELLGHADINITLSIYVHSSERIKKKYLEKI